MKKIKVLFIVLLLSIFVSGCSNKEVEPGELIEITPTQFQEKLVNNDKFVFYVGASWCNHCMGEYKPLVTTLCEEKGITMYYLLVDQYETSEIEFIVEDYGVEYLPTTFVFENGELQESQHGVLTEKQVMKYYKDYDLLP